VAGSQSEEARRLKPEMSSFRLLVLGFVRDYWTDHGGSPSYGEIANALDTNRMRVKRAVLALVDDGELLRTPGARGLRLPDQHENALNRLRELGYAIDPERKVVSFPGQPVTKPTLPVPPELDYPRDAEPDSPDDRDNMGDGGDKQGEGTRTRGG